MRRVSLALIGALTLFYLFCMNYADSYVAAIAWNRFKGELSLQEGGWHVTPPWVRVATIDTRPIRVCVPTTGRDVGCKLVRFKREAYREFVRAQGFHYWWWSNRFSINMGYDDEYRGMKDILRGYAFSGDSYPFLEIQMVYGER